MFQRFCYVVLVLLLVIVQLYQGVFLLALKKNYDHEEQMLLLDHEEINRPNPKCPTPKFPPLPSLSHNESFGACLMVKGDNDLLTEWIPYHYTILPLRFVLVASDVGNSEDPTDVLKKWTNANTGLEYQVVNTSVFENLHGKFKVDEESSLHSLNRKLRRRGQTPLNSRHDNRFKQEIAHHHLVHKQRALISYCIRFMKQKGIHWATFHDTDEFLVMNRIGSTEATENVGPRRHLPPFQSNATVIDVIYSLEEIDQPLQSCHTMPRVLVGGLPHNFSCPGSEDTKMFANSNFQHMNLTTLTYQQHAEKNDFDRNKWGKVFMNISHVEVKDVPLNVHRPYTDCRRPAVPVSQAPFYLMHYVGGWERFKAKGDKRRGYKEWKKHANVANSTSCCEQEMFQWLPRFVDQVGLKRAKYLLGDTENNVLAAPY